ncbi:type I-U CRISPR-associated RAMP protein Csb1/Cas7u [Nocardia sp. BMG111209]|uniref:type I-G CRISPR-associated RAMP protein Csb1/Cas7g n=1 Tax=Nocardia sp. BMG111209 TaxID=1160137 RepID=UPI0003A81A96|nr:type I-U CRISPR-associated RAMP protein Csb1/Cas7u [Nocardia sp. BMG111209]
MTILTYRDLLDACSPGGAAVLTSVTELAPAGGPHAAVAPAKFSVGKNSVFAYETRFIVDEPLVTVIIDSKQSQLNRMEQPLSIAIDDGHPVLGRTPRMRVSYGNASYTDLELPHRAFDGHIRAGTVAGTPVTEHLEYRAARDASARNARALLEMSPVSLIFGAWDSSRRTHQGRYRSALVGEIIGVLADQSATATTSPLRGGARVDPVAMSVQLPGAELEKLVRAQESELSTKTVAGLRDEIAKAKSKPLSASPLGMGGIPPTLDALGAVACRQIIRTHVLSFSALRQLRFGADAAGDAACRALLAAFALNGLARSDAELSLRANCDLRELGPAEVVLDQRYGKTAELEPLTIEEADELLATAIAGAIEKAGVRWEGQVFEVTGNLAVLRGAVDTDDDK